MGNGNVENVNGYTHNMQGVFIAGSAGGMFYLGTAIVLLIYCDSSIVFDMMSIALTFAMNVQCFICQV